jgi:G3E family GTPase
MIKIDLVTGFLGSGKTTFIRGYAGYLMRQGKRIAILENDYGAINVDMMMLEDLEGDQCDLQMVVGGSDYDCHKRRLKSKLITLGMLGYDRVIMEPSGIFDVDEFLDTLREEPLDRWYEIGSIITVTDASLADELSDDSEYLLVSQTANAGAVVFSRTESADADGIEAVIRHINRAFEKFQCSRRLGGEDLILRKPREAYEDGDYEQILRAGMVPADHIKIPVTDNNSYHSLFYMNVVMNPEELRPTLEKLFADKSCGDIIRIKGYLLNGENGSAGAQEPEGAEKAVGKQEPEGAENAVGEQAKWIGINATAGEMNIGQASTGQEVLIVIGENLDRDRIGSYFRFRYGSGKELLDPSDDR